MTILELDYFTLDTLSRNHGGWRLLRSEHAPLVAGFLYRAFVEPNLRMISRGDLAEKLEDELFQLRASLGPKAFPREAAQYLDDWAGNDKGWLRKFYPPGSDEPHYDITPSTEKAIAWLSGLQKRSFVGTESRLRILFELLREICQGTEGDPQERLKDLEERKKVLEGEMDRIRRGEMALLDETALRDRFQQFLQTARDLLGDFREVEENFRSLDRDVRERIALWEGTKGELLEEILGRRDAITDSDQGKSFRAFWDFLLSPERQEAFSAMLRRVADLEALAREGGGNHLGRIHYDWLDAGEHTQRMVARLSRELRRFLDDKAWLENRRIMDLLRRIEARTLKVRTASPPGDFISLPGLGVELNLPLERPLFTPSGAVKMEDLSVEEGEADLDTEALFSMVVVDSQKLLRNLREALKSRGQITLGELLEQYPLEQGLAELVAYLNLSAEDIASTVDPHVYDQVWWQTEEGLIRRGSLLRVLFVRSRK